MRIYLAGPIPYMATNYKKVGISSHELYHDANVLMSFVYCNDYITSEIFPNCKRLLLDSGAFTFFSAGKTVDWPAYVDRYADFIKRYGIKSFFELDIDPLVGYERVLDLRKRLEDRTGMACIPVWHKSRGPDRFYEMCEQYSYVAIGGIVSREIKRGEYRAFKGMIQSIRRIVSRAMRRSLSQKRLSAPTAGGPSKYEKGGKPDGKRKEGCGPPERGD